LIIRLLYPLLLRTRRSIFNSGDFQVSMVSGPDIRVPSPVTPSIDIVPKD
jgi:hypothetical protein